MTWLVFDCRKATGYLFETRHKWLAHWFCVIASKVTRGPAWDYDAALDFTPWEPSEAELDWREVYGA